MKRIAHRMQSVITLCFIVIVFATFIVSCISSPEGQAKLENGRLSAWIRGTYIDYFVKTRRTFPTDLSAVTELFENNRFEYEKILFDTRKPVLTQVRVHRNQFSAIVRFEGPYGGEVRIERQLSSSVTFKEGENGI